MSYPPPPAYPPAPQAAPSGPLRGRTPRRLGWIFLALAVVLIVVGSVVLAKKSLGKVNDFERVSFASGSGTVSLDGTGKWVGYYEADDVDSSIDEIPAFRVQVTSPSGEDVELKTFGDRSDGKIKKLTYQYNGHNGAAAFEFRTNEKGDYRVQLDPGENVASDAEIAIGRDIERGTVLGSLLLLAGVLALITSVVLLIVGFVKRSRHKKELNSAQFYGYGPQPAFGAPGGYPPPPGYGDVPQPGYAPPPSYQGEQPGDQQPPSYPGSQPPPYPGNQPPPYQGQPVYPGNQPPPYEGQPVYPGNQPPPYQGEQPGGEEPPPHSGNQPPPPKEGGQQPPG